jgi:hypothetical protein
MRSPTGPPDDRSASNGKRKQEEQQLGVLDRKMESINQIKGVVAADTGKIEKLGKNQRHQDSQREKDGKRRQLIPSAERRLTPFNRKRLL